MRLASNKLDRAIQTERVMPLIGPLLDAWEDVAESTKNHLRDGCGELCECLDNIAAGMEV